MILPVDKNIRFVGFSRPQRWEVGLPSVLPGDWLASRNGTLYYHRQPWEGSPFVTQPALSGLGAGLWDVTAQAGADIGAIASQAVASVAAEALAGTRCTTTTRPGGSTYWRGVQEALCALGINPGPIDGIYGTRTAAGIRTFQQQRGLSQTGTIDQATASALGVQVSAGQATGARTAAAATTGGPTTPVVVTSSIASFFDLRNPVFWLAIAGVILTGVGMSYGYARYKAGRAEQAKEGVEKARGEYSEALGEMSDEELDRYLYEQAAAAGQLSAPRKGKRK